jgi:hypothetical protein
LIYELNCFFINALFLLFVFHYAPVRKR